MNPSLIPSGCANTWSSVSPAHRSTCGGFIPKFVFQSRIRPVHARAQCCISHRRSRHTVRYVDRRAFPRSQINDAVDPYLRPCSPRQVDHVLCKTSFVRWLAQHVQQIIVSSRDTAYSTFLTSLLPIIRSEPIWRLLHDGKPTNAQILAWHPSQESEPVALIDALRVALAANGETAVQTQLQYSYGGLLAESSISVANLVGRDKLVDLQYPAQWYPSAREIQRTIHLHVGPTNSGKTYHALKRLERANSGLYAGPLRLLAHEVYTRMNAQGKHCDLVTGDEQIVETDKTFGMRSCTVEMVPLNVEVDVAVIDEIQMIGDQERGWAWTRAFLGLRAKELHLCGEHRAVPLVRELAASIGDKLVTHTYERLSPLEMMSRSLCGELKKLRKGDCVIVFSRFDVHDMKRQIELATQKRVAIVYGGLPPDVRAQQAKLFNEPDSGYDILVATNAIGMGLNLAIKRIIFQTVNAFNGSSIEIVDPSQIKQIAGRAGRFRTAHQAQITDVGGHTTVPIVAELASSNLGLVTTMREQHLPIVRQAMHHEAEPILTAGLIPPDSVLLNFASYFPPSINFSYILLRLHEISLLHPRFHLCNLKEQTQIADAIQPVMGLTVRDRIIFCASPASPTDSGMPEILLAFAKCVGQNTSGEILSIQELPLSVLDEEVKFDRQYMSRLEFLHKALILYLWLSYRFAGVFISQRLAFHIKKLVETKIDEGLGEYTSNPTIQKEIAKMKAKTLLQVQNSHGRVPMSDQIIINSDITGAGSPQVDEATILKDERCGTIIPDAVMPTEFPSAFLNHHEHQ